MTGSRCLILAFTITLFPSAAHAQQPAIKAVLMCQSNQLSLGTDDENGNFDGMSHSGTLLVLRNISSTACRIQPIPQISFKTSAGKDVPIVVTQKNNPFQGPLVNGKRVPMGHGPVVIPITVVPNAEATLTLTWVSGDVYDHGTCLTPAALLLTLRGSTLQTPFSGHVCGPDPSHVGISATRFALDPTSSP